MSKAFNIYANQNAELVDFASKGAYTPRVGRGEPGSRPQSAASAHPKRPNSANPPRARIVAGGRINKLKTAIALAKSDEDDIYARMQR